MISFFGLDLIIENKEGNGTKCEWLFVILGFIGFFLYLNWLYTLIVLGILTLILGSLIFDKSFNAIEKEIKEQNNGR